MSERATNKQVTVFIMLGFTIAFGVFLAVLRVLWTMYYGDVANAGGGIPLKLLGNSLLFAVPASFMTLFIVNTKRKVIEISSLFEFLSSVLIAAIAYWIIFAMFGMVRGDFNLVKHFAVLGAAIPLISLCAGAVIWKIRHVFGFKVL